MVDPAPQSECLLQVLSLVEKPINLTLNDNGQFSGQVPYLQVTRQKTRKIKHSLLAAAHSFALLDLLQTQRARDAPSTHEATEKIQCIYKRAKAAQRSPLNA